MNYTYGELIKVMLKGKYEWVRFTGLDGDTLKFMTEDDFQKNKGILKT